MLYRISQLFFELLVRILLRPRIFSRENIPEPPYIIAANHASYADPPLIGMAFRKHAVDFMAKNELFERPLFGLWIRTVNVISVRRGKSNVQSMREAIRRLRRKRVIGIFPEGTRSVDGTLQGAELGTGFLISKAAVPVVPVYIKNTGKALPKTGGIRVGTEVSVHIGKPVLPEEFSSRTGGRKDYELISDLVMDRIAELERKAGE